MVPCSSPDTNINKHISHYTLLLDLPVEILLWIAEEFPTKRDVKTLCEVSTHLYQDLIPFLYERLAIWAPDENKIWDLDVENILGGPGPVRTMDHIRHHTKHIEVNSAFHANLRHRCHHSEEWDSEEEKKVINEPRIASSKVASLLQCCGDNNLRSFAWTMGTCVPQEVIESLSRRQKSIENLFLITSASCAYRDPGLCAINLLAFPCLRKLSWKSMRVTDDKDALKVALRQLSPQLVTLELDPFVGGIVRDELFIPHVLEIPSANTTRLFRAIRSLFLSKVSLKGVAQNMAHALDWGLLRSLTLRLCDGWEPFLQFGRELNYPARLKALDIQSASKDESNAGDSITSFLHSFQGLEQLCISIGSPSTAIGIWEALGNHGQTLRTFVHHHRGDDDPDLLSDSDNSWSDDDEDLDLTFDPGETVKWSTDTTRHPLNGLGLEFLGLCCRPTSLLHYLKPLTLNRSLRVLHIRQSDVDVDFVGNWGIESPSDDTESEIDSSELEGRIQAERAANSSEPGRPTQAETVTESAYDTHAWNEAVPHVYDDTGLVFGSSASEESMQAEKLSKPLQNLARWAFGPKGLLSLQVIALGDFSYEGRYAKNQVVLTRNGGKRDLGFCTGRENFRHMLPTDERYVALVDDYEYVLAACPTSHLLNDG